MLLYRVTDPSDGDPCYAVKRGDLYHRTNLTLAQLAEVVLDGDGIITTGRSFALAPQVAPLAPVAPGKIICVGLNYAHHAAEMSKAVPEQPLLFMKPPSAVIGPRETIELPPSSQEVHHEGELAIVIGKTARRVAEADAARHILGYTCANDVTARDIQRAENRYTRAKGFDTFCPLGPALILARDFDPAAHAVTCRVNGEVRQQSGIDDLIFAIPHLISFISHVMTLHPGDVILTGTPSGVGALLDGDVVDVEIDGIGTLQNRVARAS